MGQEAGGTMSCYRRKDDVLGTVTIWLPHGYRPIGTREMARRKRRCEQMDDWTDLDRVTLYDPATGRHLPISAGAYRLLVFVEKRKERK